MVQLWIAEWNRPCNVYYETNISLQSLKLKVALREKPYLPGPGMSWKTQKDEANVIFSSTFWLKKNAFPIAEKLKTSNQ